ncbi:MAG: hypothetical protein IKF29_00440 [Oceanobacillus sp.]|nr:hypothetical protein [Oceanobacillus sp.]
MTNKERNMLFDEFHSQIVNMVKAYLRFDHLTEYETKFDTGGKVKEIYEIKIRKVKNGNAPTVEPEGKWIGNAFDEHRCNKCGHYALWEEEPGGYYEVQSRFCPYCGAKMEGEEK